MARVLVVEDTPEIALFLELYLTGEKVQVVTRDDDFEKLLHPEPWEGVSVAVVDIVLPEISGMDILRWLKVNRPDIRRIAMSSSTAHLEEAEPLAHATMTKPFPLGNLRALVLGHG